MKIIKYIIPFWILLLGVGFLPANDKSAFSLIMKEDQTQCFTKVIDWIYEDVRQLDEVTASYTRYFTIHSTPYRERLDFIRAFTGHLNQLSLETDLVKPEILPDTQISVLRIDIRSLGWKVEVFEQLADADPLFHIKLIDYENIVEAKYNGPFPGPWHQDGKKYWRYTSKTHFEIYQEGIYRIKEDSNYTIINKRKILKQITAIAPYVSYSEQLKFKTDFIIQQCQTNVPFVRGDWFLWQTLAQNDRKPGYADFVGLKDRDTFEKTIGFNEKFLKESKRFEILEAVSKSGVSQKPRRIAVFNTVGDLHYWRTFDSKVAKDDHNPLRVLDNNLKHDAEESFGSLPNGFWLWGLFNDKGVRQDSAPDFIGYNRFSQNNNGRIELCISCIQCHYTTGFGDSGIISFRPWTKNAFSGGFHLQSIDYDTLEDLRRKYYRNIEIVSQNDIHLHNSIVKRATGVDANTWARLVLKYYNLYEKTRTIQDLANDLCVEEGKLKTLFIEYAKGNTSYQKSVDYHGIEKLRGLDIVLTGLVRGESIEVEQYEEVYPLAAFIVRFNL